MLALNLAIAFLIGYLFGSIPFGLLLTRLAGTRDIRTIGSGNIGATNVLRTGRKGLAAATLICDALKGTFAVIVGGYIAGPNGAIVAALGAFLGHLFPVWLKFKGGKGVATYIGLLIGLPLLIGGRIDREPDHAVPALVVRPPGAGHAVRRADAAAVVHAPRQHRDAGVGQGIEDRRKGVSAFTDRFAAYSAIFFLTCLTGAAGGSEPAARRYSTFSVFFLAFAASA